MSYYMRYYSQWHDFGNVQYQINSKNYFFKILHDYLPQNKNSSILEIGCSDGMALLMLKEQGYSDITGIDICEDLINVAKNFDLNVKCVDALEYLNTTTKKFDFIYMSDLIEHIPLTKIGMFLTLIYNSLNNNGKLWCLTPNANSFIGTYLRYIDPTHFTIFSPTSISYKLAEAGFKKIIISELNSFPQESQIIDSIMKNIMARYFINQKSAQIITPNLIAIAEKVKNNSPSEIIYKEIPAANSSVDIIKDIEQLSDIKKDLENWKESIEAQINDIKQNTIDNANNIKKQLDLIQNKTNEMNNAEKNKNS